MALLAEYALTPDVFDLTSYSTDEVCGLHLQSIKDVLLHEALVRNLRNGEWATLFSGNYRPWHRRGKELLKKTRSAKTAHPSPSHEASLRPHPMQVGVTKRLTVMGLFRLAGLLLLVPSPAHTGGSRRRRFINWRRPLGGLAEVRQCASAARWLITVPL